MNLNCPTCNDRLRDDGRCDRCAANYDDIVGAGPDPYELASGLDVKALEDEDARREVANRTRDHLLAEGRLMADDRANERAAVQKLTHPHTCRPPQEVPRALTFSCSCGRRWERVSPLEWAEIAGG